MEAVTRSYQRPVDGARPGHSNANPAHFVGQIRVLKPFHGFVELSSKYDEALLRDLVLAAYEASKSGLVILALNGISTREVDRVLDTVVRVNGWGVGDLRYVRADVVDNKLLMRAAQSEFVIVHSSALSAALLSRGTGYMSAAGGLRYLDALTRAEDDEPSISEPMLATG